MLEGWSSVSPGDFEMCVILFGEGYFLQLFFPQGGKFLVDELNESI